MDKKEKEYKYCKLSDEEIDKVIMRTIANMAVNGGTNTRWSKPELVLRHSVILNYVRQGLSKKRIFEELVNRWDIAEITAKNYYDAAINYLGEINTGEDIGKIKQRQQERLMKVVEDGLKNNRYHTALQALDQLNKINGLYTENKNVSVDGQIKFEFD